MHSFPFLRDQVSLSLPHIRIALMTVKRGAVGLPRVVVSRHAWHAGDLGSIPGPGMLYFRCKNLVLYVRDCDLCVFRLRPRPFYPMPGEVKYDIPDTG